MKVIILNGPIGSGKDTIAARLVEMFRGTWADDTAVARWCFKDELWRCLGEHFMLSDIDLKRLKARHDDRALKEIPVHSLGNLSTRQALIYISEDVMKPRLGKDVFGWYAAATLADLKECGYRMAIGSDGGFIEELRPIARKYETYVFRLLGRGSYEGDSRRYLEPEETEQAGARCLVDINLVEGRPDLAVQQILETLVKYK